MDADNQHYVGVEVGGTKLQVVLGDGQGDILKRFRMEVDKSAGAAAIRTKIADTLKDLLGKHKPAAVGVGFGGPLDFQTGIIALSNQIEGWAGFELGGWLGELTHLPVKVDNDANTAALAETCKGSGRNFSRVFYVTLGSGMGAGMVIDGKIYHGAKPGEAEIGLMCFDKTGANVESHCCGWAVDKKIEQYVAQHPDSILAKLVGQASRGQARFLLQALEQGDAGAAGIFAELTEDLAFALSLAGHLFHPEVMIIGGGLSLMGEPLQAAVAERLPTFMTAALKPGPEIKLAGLGEDVVCVGALLLAKKAVRG